MNLNVGDPFKWRHFHGLVILQCVRWYCKYGISYRDLEEMMGEKEIQSTLLTSSSAFLIEIATSNPLKSKSD